MSRPYLTPARAAMLLAASALTMTAATAHAQTPKSSQPVAAPPAALSYGTVVKAPASVAAKPATKSAAPVAKPGLRIVDKPASQAAPYDDAADKLLHQHHHRRHHVVHRSPVQSVLHEAEVQSTEVPHAAEMINSILNYAYEPGKLYTVHTAPGFLTAIALRPGEHLISKSAGDTARWDVGETLQGHDQIVILIKPLDAGLRTNMILTTDQRVYVIDLVSGASSAEHTTFVAWHYPTDEMRELTLQRAAATVQALAAQAGPTIPASPLITPPGAPVPVGPGRISGPPSVMRPIAEARAAQTADIAPTKLDFDYKIEPKGHAPSWTPVHVFDDGQKVFVKFPENVSTMEIPPLFVIGAHGEAELVNYRFEDGYYVVDRLFSVAELRLGSKDQKVVRIVFRGGAR
jgi:type IV secretion system protein VirB9